MRVNDKTKREKEFIRWELRERDGDGSRGGTKCFVDHCMTEEYYLSETGKDFDICHLDDNPQNWDMQNLFLATHKCNCQLTPRGLGKLNHLRPGYSLNSLQANKKRSVIDKNTYIDDAGLRIDSLPLYRNVKLKPLAIIEFEKIIREKTQVEKDGLLDAMANASGLTQEKCGKYLKALTNPHNGNYEELPKDADGKVFIRKRST